jgi:broad specificity phosphatase PhoE
MKVLTWRRVLEENSHALIAIRHGETEYNLEDRCATSTDVPLTAAGRIAALEAAGSLSGVTIDGVFSSPLSRARKTADLMLPSYKEVADDARLREPSAGPFEREVFSQLWSGDHRLSPAFMEHMDEDNPVTPEGAEPIEGTVERVSSFLADLERTPGRYVAFSHGGLLRIMASMFAGGNPRRSHRLKLDNCHAIALKWYPNPPHQVLAINLPPSPYRGRVLDVTEKRSRVEVTALGPKAAAAYGRRKRL